jgi:hypothetical protein
VIRPARSSAFEIVRALMVRKMVLEKPAGPYRRHGGRVETRPPWT